MQSSLYDLLASKIFYATVLAWLCAQVMKTLVEFVLLRSKKTKNDGDDTSLFQDVMISLFWKTGGMPSSHSSMVTALSTSTAIQEGISSSLFFVTFFFATVVIRDASGVRQTLGRLGHKYNELIRIYNEAHPKDAREYFRVVEGHSSSEVFVGVLLGFSVAVTVFLL